MNEQHEGIDTVRLYTKPFDELDEYELKLESKAHKWLARRIDDVERKYSAKLKYMRENHPVDEDTREQVLEDYENGLIDMKQRKKRMTAITKREHTHLEMEAHVVLAHRAMEHHRAVGVDLDERLRWKQSNRKFDPGKATSKANRGRGKNRSYDPTKNVTRYNRAPWHKQLPPKKRKPRPNIIVNRLNKKWDKISLLDRNFKFQHTRWQELTNYDYNNLKKIAYDRGFTTTQTFHAVVAEALGCSVVSVRPILTDGRMSWRVVMTIAALFEMTPAEYCDVFLKGFFQEVVDGKWVATLPDMGDFRRLGRDEDEPTDEQGDNRTEDDDEKEEPESHDAV